MRLIERVVGRLIFRLPTRAHQLLAGRPARRDGQRLDPSLQLMLRLRRLKGRHGVAGLDPVRARRFFRRESELIPDRNVPGMRLVRDISVDGADGPLAARHYVPHPRPGDDELLPLLVFFHGGGWVVCDIETHDTACRIFAEYGRVQVLSVEYRLAPEHPFPAARYDSMAAWHWAREHAAELGADPARIAVGGDSAGGNLSAHLCQDMLETGEQPPAAQLLIYPSVDLLDQELWASHRMFAENFFLSRDDMVWFASQYFGAAAPESFDGYNTPLRSGLHANLAPALVVTAGFDPLRDEGEEYARILQGAGTHAELVRYRGMLHGFINMTGVSRGARAATEDIGRRLGALLRTASGSADGIAGVGATDARVERRSPATH